MAMEKEQSKLKILMFPWLAHGHISPFLELSKRLSKKNFDIYLCSTAINLDSIKTNDHESIKLVELKMPSLPELPPKLHTTKNLPSNLMPTLIQAFQKSSSSFSNVVDSVNPDLLIYDFFQPWAPKVASSKGIPSVHFLTSGATPFSFYHHFYTMGTGSTFPFKGIHQPDDDIIRMRDSIGACIKDADKDFAFGNLSLSNEIVLVNSCREVEEKYIDYLSVLSKKKTIPTGPLIGLEYDHDNEENLKIQKWLSEKDHFSTIYISFGSECFLSKDQIAEIAKGLQFSCVNFIWVVRFPLGGVEEEFPQGFLEMVKERGIVVRWAPQRMILGHPSIGGFVSHCGWSSTMESLYFGVPVIALPMKADQPMNAGLVVEAGVGVKVDKGDGGLYAGEELAKAINEVIVEETFYGGLRSRVKGLSEKIRDKEDEEVNEAAEQLLRICLKNTKQV